MKNMAIQEKIIEYGSWINIIESQLKVFNHESCHKIYLYLRIQGKVTAATLIKKLNYSRGTVHTALNLLQDAQYIKKGKDPKIKDKRNNVYYYAIDKDLSIIDDQDFLRYVSANNKLEIYLEWLKNSIKISTTMIEFIYQFALAAKIENLKEKNPEDEIISSKAKSEPKQAIITYSELGSLENQEKVAGKIIEFLESLKEDFIMRKSHKEPIVNPTLLSLFYIPIS